MRCLFAVLGVLSVALIGEAKQPKAPKCEDPSNVACVAEAASYLKSKMKNPDSFRLAKVSLTAKGRVCFRFNAETGQGLNPSGVAVWFPHWNIPFGLLPPMDNVIGHDIITGLEDDGGTMKECSTGTPMDVDVIKAAMKKGPAAF